MSQRFAAMTSRAALAITLLVVVIAPHVTSEPSLQSNARKARSASHSEHATSHALGQSRRDGFEWNARRVGNKKVATISIRKDEERDRRSVPLGDLKIPPAMGVALGGSHAHRHHHGDMEWGRRGGGGGRRREEEYSEEEEEEEEEIGGVDAPPRYLVARTSLLQEEEEEEEQEEEEEEEGRISSLESSSGVSDLLFARGQKTERVSFANLSRARLEVEEEEEEEEEGRVRRRRRGRGGGGGRKVKRDRKRRGKEGRKKRKKKKKGRKKSKKCRKLKGKEKKKCKQDEDMLSFIKHSTTMSGSEACQYHNLEECYKKVGPVDGNRSVVKCRYREAFLQCMENQREGECAPGFQTEGDMVALRNRIRDEIWTTNSCLISVAIEG